MYWVVLLMLSILLGPGLLGTGVAFRPLGVPDPATIEYPNDAAPSPAEISLGKALFFDKRLSVNSKTSCATCHDPNHGFSDGVPLGKGTMGNTLGRHTPHLYNLAWGSSFFWDGRAKSLEEQALGPIEAPGEMSMALDKLVGKLKAIPFYIQSFEKVYPKSKITKENIGKAIAAFERTIVSNNSPFDRYMKGDKSAITQEAVRGMQLFVGKAGCANCHDGANFTDDSFHNIGIGGKDKGRAAIVRDETLLGAFKTPGLRNIALTAPYMHDGSLKTLKEVVRFYNEGGRHKQGISDLIKPLQLTESEMSDLVAFLVALTDPVRISPPVGTAREVLSSAKLAR
jgi:cytochrome c peroxidase